jgi:hypothetical protein
VRVFLVPSGGVIGRGVHVIQTFKEHEQRSKKKRAIQDSAPVGARASDQKP